MKIGDFQAPKHPLRAWLETEAQELKESMA